MLTDRGLITIAKQNINQLATKKMKIELKNGHLVKITKKPTGDNYGLFASVYKTGDKTPLFGTVFKDGTDKKEIKSWAEKKINWQKDPLRELFEGFNI